MDQPWILPVDQYYARMNHYILEYGLPYSTADCMNWQEDIDLLRPLLGEAEGRAVLDCSCGWGRQAVALAKLGWQVTATDVSATSLDFARRFAAEEGAAISFDLCDMRALAQHYEQCFDWAISCYALYEIPDDAGILQALKGIYGALKPGGKLYLRFRDMDFLMEEKPRHVFHGERKLDDGRMLCIEDWDFVSEDEVVALNAFLREYTNRDPSDHFRWETETIGCRKRVMRKENLRRLLGEAGFAPVEFLPQPAPWFEVQIIAEK